VPAARPTFLMKSGASAQMETDMANITASMVKDLRDKTGAA
jgi:hypothetical protein